MTPINFENSTRTIRVENGLAAIDAVLGGPLTGTRASIKPARAPDSLPRELLHRADDHIGRRLSFTYSRSLPGGMDATGGTSNLNLAGGQAGLNYLYFNRALGSGPDQVRFTASGGFSGGGTVNLGGKATPLKVAWGSGGFVPDGATFILGSTDSSGNLYFMNPIDLGDAMRTIRTDCSTFSPGMFNASVKGALSGAGGVMKTGNGTLQFAATNIYTGETQVTGGVLQLLNPLGLPAGSVDRRHEPFINHRRRKDHDERSFRRNLGPNPTDVQFSGSGGFFGGYNVVNLGGTSAPSPGTAIHTFRMISCLFWKTPVPRDPWIFKIQSFWELGKGR